MSAVQSLEQLMYQVADLLLAPVLVIIAALFVYSLIALGRFTGLYLQRKRNAMRYQRFLDTSKSEDESAAAPMAGYQLHNYWVANRTASSDELEVFALKKLENLRVVTRIAPMLGLIATMIPMGPALKALGDGNLQGISDNLVIAFAAVIWALVISSLTYWPANVKKRWLATELININSLREGKS